LKKEGDLKGLQGFDNQFIDKLSVGKNKEIGIVEDHQDGLPSQLPKKK